LTALTAAGLGAVIGFSSGLFALFLLAFGLFFLARTFYRAEMYGWFT